MDTDIIQSIQKLDENQFFELLTNKLKELNKEALKKLFFKYCIESSYEEIQLKNDTFELVTYKPMQPGESDHIVAGIYYELPDKSICTIFGANSIRREVRYCFEDGTVKVASYKEVKQWKPRRDLHDWPNAKDPKLPYIFDLYWDMKRISDLKRALRNGHKDLEYIKRLMCDHNISVAT
jgi:hypothetical protein